MFSDTGILKDIVSNHAEHKWSRATDELVHVLQEEIAAYINKEILKRMSIPAERLEP